VKVVIVGRISEVCIYEWDMELLVKNGVRIARAAGGPGLDGWLVS